MGAKAAEKPSHSRRERNMSNIHSRPMRLRRTTRHENGLSGLTKLCKLLISQRDVILARHNLNLSVFLQIASSSNLECCWGKDIKTKTVRHDQW